MSERLKISRRTIVLGTPGLALAACREENLTPEQISIKNNIESFLGREKPPLHVNPNNETYEQLKFHEGFEYTVGVSSRTGVVKQGRTSVAKRFPIEAGNEVPELTTRTYLLGNQLHFKAFVTIQKKQKESNNPLQPVADLLWGSEVDKGQKEVWGVWQEEVKDSEGRVRTEWRFNEIVHMLGESKTSYIDFR